jgi:hypothetical protein
MWRLAPQKAASGELISRKKEIFDREFGHCRLLAIFSPRKKKGLIATHDASYINFLLETDIFN